MVGLGLIFFDQLGVRLDKAGKCGPADESGQFSSRKGIGVYLNGIRNPNVPQQLFGVIDVDSAPPGPTL